MQPTISSHHKFFIAILLAASVSGCRFKAPTVAEQEYLMQKGAFPGGVPEWVATPGLGGNTGGSGVFSGGLIPQTFSRPQPDSSGIANADIAASSAGTYATPQALVKDTAKAAAEEEAKSPLNRIAKLCGSVENEVNAALLTTDLKQRIRKYESLTIRCPNSADLWLWLGKDYSKDNQLVKAGRSFERVLIIDSSIKEAEDLLAENRKELNKPRSGEAKSPE